MDTERSDPCSYKNTAWPNEGKKSHRTLTFIDVFYVPLFSDDVQEPFHQQQSLVVPLCAVLSVVEHLIQGCRLHLQATPPYRRLLPDQTQLSQHGPSAVRTPPSSNPQRLHTASWMKPPAKATSRNCQCLTPALCQPCSQALHGHYHLHGVAEDELLCCDAVDPIHEFLFV